MDVRSLGIGAILFGVLVLGETLHWNQPVGTAVLLAGVAISQGRLARLRPAVTSG